MKKLTHSDLEDPKIRRMILETFEERVIETGPPTNPKVHIISNCHLYTGYQKPNGYRQFVMNKQGFKLSMGAHTIAYIIYKGKVPPGKIVCHICGNNYCVNPDHLYVGTNQSNSQDAINNRFNVNPKNRTWKLTRHDVEQIRILFWQFHYDKHTLAEMFDVSLKTIQDIVVGRIYNFTN